MLFITVIVFISLLIWILPDEIWHKLQQTLYLTKKLTINRRGLVYRGNLAWQWTQTGQGPWPDYKFYGNFLREVQKLTKLYGSTPKASLDRIKKPLLQDIRFETKLREIRFSGLGQFVAMALMTWTFMVVSRLILERPFELPLLFSILFIQTVGLITFLQIESFKRKKAFHGFDLAYEGLVTLQALLPLGISTKDKQEKSGVDQFLSLKTKNLDLDRVRRNLAQSLAQWRDFGRPIEDIIEELVDDVRFAQEIAQAKLLKQMHAIKFLIAALFFLSAYLLDLMAMVNSFFTLK
mgnify:CR=1 FL=1